MAGNDPVDPKFVERTVERFDFYVISFVTQTDESLLFPLFSLICRILQLRHQASYRLYVIEREAR